MGELITSDFLHYDTIDTSGEYVCFELQASNLDIELQWKVTVKKTNHLDVAFIYFVISIQFHISS